MTAIMPSGRSTAGLHREFKDKGVVVRRSGQFNVASSEARIRSAIWEERALLYMIIEHFKNRDPVPVYRRFQDRGRLAPEGLRYVSSWVDEKLERCFQLMEAEDRKHLDEWVGNWNDLVEFEVYPVISSNEAAERVLSLL
jgi:hypothetical protein